MATNEQSRMPEDQITIYYDPEKNKHKKTIAHAKSIGDVLAIPFENMPEAYMIWTTIWDSIKTKPEIIFDQDHPKYDQLIKGQITNFEDWRNLVLHNRDMISAPIAVKGEQAIVCVRQTEIYQLMDVAN
jgi:arsenate reductase-like glutaredoxin family protein